MSEAVIGQTEHDRARPTSLTNQADRPRPSAEVGDKRKSAAADLAQFRLEAAPASFPADSASHTRSSSLLQDSTNTRSSSALPESHTRSSSVLQDTSTSKSASRRSRVSSRTSSRLDTTGSSGVLNSSYEEHQQSRASYYFGEAPDFRDILSNSALKSIATWLISSCSCPLSFRSSDFSFAEKKYSSKNFCLLYT